MHFFSNKFRIWWIFDACLFIVIDFKFISCVPFFDLFFFSNCVSFLFAFTFQIDLNNNKFWILEFIKFFDVWILIINLQVS